jgi:HAD superfamily hydrolase (TIGR01490 family)
MALNHVAALFDMDRTLVRVNTGNLYIRWRLRRGDTSVREAARMAGWMLQYSAGILDPSVVGERALSMLQGIDESRFQRECRHWYEHMVRPHVSDEARREVQRRRTEGAFVAILSASTPYAIEPLAEELGIDHVLCSELEVSEGQFTGVCRQLCYGSGKVTVAEQWARQHGVDLDRSTFYSDSVSDLPMLERVGKPRVVNPDPRLWWHARRRRWPVYRWR